MKTKKLNVFAEQRTWMTQHRNADSVICDDKGNVIQAMYQSPLARWKGMIAPDGTVNVPDMDYYNSLTNVAEIEHALDELFPNQE